MPKRQYKIIFISGLVFVTMFFLFSEIKKDIPLVQPISEIINQAEAQVSDISITIVIDNATVDLSFPQGLTLYEVLNEAKSEGKIDFQGREYPGLGFFVTNIGSLYKSGSKNPMYDINGIEAQVGISSYLPQNGDIISWKLK